MCDVDGTITFKDRRLDATAVDALRAAEAAGVPVVLATGNVLPIAYSLSYLVGTTGPIVAENGGLLYHKGTVLELADRGDIEEVALAVEARLGLTRLFTDRWRVTEVAFPEVRGTFDRVRREVAAHPRGARVRVERTGFAVHLMDPNSEKRKGVVEALDLMGLTPDDALACGDSDNDIGMVGACRAGVALADAPEALFRASTFVARHEAGLGLKEAFEHYGVIRATRRAPAARGGSTRARPPTPPRARRTKRKAPGRPRR